MSLSHDDLSLLASRGITAETANTQLRQLRAGQHWVRLERPCTAGDGILQLSPSAQEDFIRQFAEAVTGQRLTRFVPASGAASRMFAPLVGTTAKPATEESLRQLLGALPNFAFYVDLESTLIEAGLDLRQLLAHGDHQTLIRYLLEPCGLGYASLPKGLLAFHVVADGPRSPFIEHLAEAALANGLEGEVVLHFTVSTEHLELFQAQQAAWRLSLEETYGCRFHVTFSVQQPATDTLALNADNEPLRQADGRLTLRPGGHGALLANLSDLEGDIVLIRNIDNVVPDAHKEANLRWSKILTGCLLDLQQEQHALLKALREDPDEPSIRDLVLAFLCDRLQGDLPLDCTTEQLLDRLDRPLRVCGMVKNDGEPGGGPFWVRSAENRLSRQIVEGSQIELSDAGQAEILAASTHFNPVDMVCALRDEQGRPYELSRYVDENAVIITTKQQDGQEVRVLERPGLWNGAMAGWHTLFVEIPSAAFNPVKTVFDLLRPAHQA